MNKEIISEYYLERYSLGELPAEEAEEIGQMAAANPEIQAALENIESSNREILALYPPPMVKATLSIQLTEKQKKSFPLKRVLAISSAAVVLLTIILVLPLTKKKPGIIDPDSIQDVTLIKGIPKVDLSITQLLVYRKMQDQVEMLADGDHARAGDLLQLAYVATEEPYGMIFSIDGRGLVTLHFPEDSRESTKLELNTQLSLPNAIELDDAPGFERFIFLTSRTPIDVEAILKKLKGLTEYPEQAKHIDLDLPGNLKQYSFLILKGEGS
jgi:hypothetical protein